MNSAKLPHVRRIHVYLEAANPTGNRLLLGTLALSGARIGFQQSVQLQETSLRLSPFHLPVPTSTLHFIDVGHAHLFFGLHGVFGDSLPDGWGLMLMDRALRRADPTFGSPTGLDRLAWIGKRALGAMTYEPEIDGASSGAALDIEKLAEESEALHAGDESPDEVLTRLSQAGGSPGGARPKAVLCIEWQKTPRGKKEDGSGVSYVKSAAYDSARPPPKHERWLIKFHASSDSNDDSLVEHTYLEGAARAGIPAASTRLVGNASGTKLWIASKRFDVDSKGLPLHVHSLAGLLHENFRLCTLDYSTYLKAVRALTRSQKQVEIGFALAAFNVLLSNRDDHAKNFSFVMDARGEWSVAPAYDLTYSVGPGGEHSMTVLGEGRRPKQSHLFDLAKVCDVPPGVAKAFVHKVLETKEWISRELAGKGVSSQHGSRRLEV